MSFELDLRKFKEKAMGRTKLILQKTAIEVDRGVVLSTPVDTGRARGGWNVGINNVNLNDTDLDPSGQKSISENEATIQKAEADDTLLISNNVDYIEFLEKGSSSQSPNGMVKKTLRRFPQFVRKSNEEAKRERP